MTPPALILNNRNKGKYVYRSVAGALSQTIPCEIHIADFASTDNSRSEIERAIAEAPRGAEHDVIYSKRDEPTEGTMLAVNKALWWMVNQTECEWIFQCSSDDYSLPRRIAVCMQALAGLKAKGMDTAGLATTMKFEDPEHTDQHAVSGFPQETGYVTAGIGIHKMAYGSTIWGYRRDFLLKVGMEVPCTLDVYLGYLASLDRGYYVICDPQHVHFMAHDLENIGFQGKMRAAELAGDQATIHRINELNRFQLFELYFHTKLAQQKHYPLAGATDQTALMDMIVAQACGWYQERAQLHALKLTPSIL